MVQRRHGEGQHEGEHPEQRAAQHQPGQVDRHGLERRRRRRRGAGRRRCVGHGWSLVSRAMSTRLSPDAYLGHLGDDGAALSRLARSADLGIAVPTCPGWTLQDLVGHCGEVYAHKTAALRSGRAPQEGESAQAPPRPGRRGVPRRAAGPAHRGAAPARARRRHLDLVPGGAQHRLLVPADGAGGAGAPGRRRARRRRRAEARSTRCSRPTGSRRCWPGSPATPACWPTRRRGPDPRARSTSMPATTRSWWSCRTTGTPSARSTRSRRSRRPTRRCAGAAAGHRPAAVGAAHPRHRVGGGGPRGPRAAVQPAAPGRLRLTLTDAKRREVPWGADR